MYTVYELEVRRAGQLVFRRTLRSLRRAKLMAAAALEVEPEAIDRLGSLRFADESLALIYTQGEWEVPINVSDRGGDSPFRL